MLFFLEDCEPPGTRLHLSFSWPLFISIFQKSSSPGELFETISRGLREGRGIRNVMKHNQTKGKMWGLGSFQPPDLRHGT